MPVDSTWLDVIRSSIEIAVTPSRGLLDFAQIWYLRVGNGSAQVAE